MIKLTKENTVKAIERCKQLKPRVRFVAERTFTVESSNNANVYQVRFDVKGKDKFGACECKAAERGLVCYHIAGAAAVNILRQSIKRMAA
jgi:hypothetical protein